MFAEQVVKKKIALAIFSAILALLAVPIPSTLATGNTPTFVLGVTSPTDPLIVDLQALTSSISVLPGVTSLSLVGTNSILYVDGAWLQSVSSLNPAILTTIAQEPLKGIPTIVVRGSPSILADSISKLVGTKVPNLPLISEGVQVIGTLPDGTPQGNTFQVIAGFDYAVQAEFTWAQQLLSQTTSTSLLTKTNTRGFVPAVTAPIASSGTWAFAASARTSSGDYFNNTARITYEFTVFSLQNSGSSSYRWFNFFSNETLQPSISYSTNNWRTAEEADNVVLNNQTSNLIVAHGPQFFGTSGPSVLTYTIGTQAGVLNAAITANQTQSYPLKNTQVTDTTTNSTSNIGWDHQINARTSSGKLTFSIIPGWTDRVTTPGSIDLRGSLTSSFDDFTTNSVRSITLGFSIFGG